MNLIFRFLRMWVLAHIGSRIDVMAEHRLAFRCLLTDIDLNRHMTNSRYHSFMDLARFDLMIRAGAWSRLRRAGLSPVLGSSSIRFRRPVKPWQRFEITVRILSWDDRWIYIEHRFLAGGETAAIAIVKTTFIDKSGRAPTDRIIALMGYTGPKPAFAELLAAKDALDQLLTA